MATEIQESTLTNGVERYLAGSYDGRIAVMAKELGITNIRTAWLGVYVPAKVGWLSEEAHAFPVACLGVVPAGVVRYGPDPNPRQRNSLRRFNYILGLRAVPLELVGAREPGTTIFLFKKYQEQQAS